MNILITGGCGFVGSNLAIFLKKKYHNYNITCLDNLKRRGSELNIPTLKNLDIKFIHGDVRIISDFDEVGPIDLLIEAAAEPSVLAGNDGGTEYLTDTNLKGTINCLNYAIKFKAAFIFLSTSRVYPLNPLENATWTERETRFEWDAEQKMQGISSDGVSETLSLHGHRSLYGATKLASELIINEYVQMFDLKAIINRCGVIAGPYQMGKIDQGVVVLWASKHLWKGKLSYIGYGGKGKQVRDVLHINDLCFLIDLQIQDLSKYSGETYNVGGGINSSISLLELTKICEEISGNIIEIKEVEENRKSDLRIYITDNSKISAQSGWKPLNGPKEILVDIFNWLRSNENQLKQILS
jgi:CDP-paratose 2-epimerase